MEIQFQIKMTFFALKICFSGSALDTMGKVLRVTVSVGKVILLLAFLYMFICSMDILSSAFQLMGGKCISLEPSFFFPSEEHFHTKYLHYQSKENLCVVANHDRRVGMPLNQKSFLQWVIFFLPPLQMCKHFTLYKQFCCFSSDKIIHYGWSPLMCLWSWFFIA